MDNRVVKGEDGVYRWIYRLDMKKNPAIFNTVIEAVAITFGLIYLLMLGVFAVNGHLREGFLDMTPIFLLAGAVLAVITLVCFWGIRVYYNGHFTYCYEMDDESVTFAFYDESKEKTKQIGELSILTGFLLGNYGLVGSGANMAYVEQHRSVFKKVYSIKAVEKYDLIKVNSFMLFNQIYVNKEDYRFVLEFIEERTGKRG